MSEMPVFPAVPQGTAMRQMSRPPGQEEAPGWTYPLLRAAEHARAPLRDPVLRLRYRMAAGRVMRQARRLQGQGPEALAAELDRVRPSLRRGRPLNRAGLRALAVIAATARQTLGLDPFAVQIMGALALNSGRLLEMETGSGKTLTAALAAALAAAGGEQVHVITANDYLAARDHAELLPFYGALGISAAVITHEIAPAERVSAYRAQIVHASNKEIAFDYLRNRIALGAASGAVGLGFEAVLREDARARSLTMQGLPLAIVDEADAVLIDECRTPLIISRTARPDPEWAHTALALADMLKEGRDYTLDVQRRHVELTPRGQARLAEEGERRGGIWRNGLRREHAAVQGVSGRLLFLRDEHYIVQEGAVKLIDEFTGRVAPDRALGEGLQQVIEAKEGVEISGERETLGRMTYQRFFRRYARLAGMTGTAREVSGEFAAVYGLPVLTLAPPRRSRRRYLRTRLHRDGARKWAAVARRTRAIAAKGRPVLLATRTIAASLELSAVLEQEGLEHVMLNAAQDADEAEVIARAGEPGRITLATNMAGRGVDIKLTEAVRRAGGLHVILTECHEARRIDRQVLGRCARQGDPGSCEIFLAWDDPIVSKFGGWRQRLRRGGWPTFRRAQKRAEALTAEARIELLRQDMQRDQYLGFSGGGE